MSSICTSGMGDVVIVSITEAAGILEAQVRPRDSSGVPMRAGSLDCQKEGIVPGVGTFLVEDEEVVR